MEEIFQEMKINAKNLTNIHIYIYIYKYVNNIYILFIHIYICIYIYFFFGGGEGGRIGANDHQHSTAFQEIEGKTPVRETVLQNKRWIM